jgi:hypothetical protein
MSGRGAAIMFSVRELASVEKGLFCYGTAPSVADIFLVSQLGNARGGAQLTCRGSSGFSKRKRHA